MKVEERNLFYRDAAGRCKEIRPLCVLDFFVHESVQRQGVGKVLFSFMLEHENVEPKKLAYDRPSPKLVKFLEKHYRLRNFIPQNNNFLVFDDYFRDRDDIDRRQGREMRGLESKSNNPLVPRAQQLQGSSSNKALLPSITSQFNFRSPSTNAFEPLRKLDSNTNPVSFDKFREKLNQGVGDLRRSDWKLSNLPLSQLPIREENPRSKIAEMQMNNKGNGHNRMLPQSLELQHLNNEIKKTEEELTKIKNISYHNSKKRYKISNWDYQWL